MNDVWFYDYVFELVLLLMNYWISDGRILLLLKGLAKQV
jgi:hypothetical protein